MEGGAIAAAVGPYGQPWVVNRVGTIYARTRSATGYVDGMWEVMPGKATAIASGADGSVWAVGASTANGGKRLYHHRRGRPTVLAGQLSRVRRDSDAGEGSFFSTLLNQG